MSKNYASILIIINLVKIIHLRHSSHFLRHFFKKTAELAGQLHASCAHDLLQGEGGIWLLFDRKLINCPLKHCEIWKQGQFKH